jgi:hypothetical protein
MKLLRGGAPRPSLQGVVVLAETIGEEPASVGATTALVDVIADPAWMPRLRWPLLTGAMALLAAAAHLEMRRRRRQRKARETAPSGPVVT